MRHGMANRKLGRTSAHRKALFRNQLASILDKERIVTTLIKAKELRPIVERMITLGKIDSVHTRRLAAQTIAENTLVQKLFTDVSVRFSSRPGGYLRIVKLGPRRGDGAEMAILEFVDYELGKDTTSNATPTKGGKKAAVKAEAATTPAATKGAKGAAKNKDAEVADGEKAKKPRKKKDEAAE